MSSIQTVITEIGHAVQKNLRVQSLVLTTFPWTTSIVMSPILLSNIIKNDHYAFVGIPFHYKLCCSNSYVQTGFGSRRRQL